jgi:hypothetical protein
LVKKYVWGDLVWHKFCSYIFDVRVMATTCVWLYDDKLLVRWGMCTSLLCASLFFFKFFWGCYFWNICCCFLLLFQCSSAYLIFFSCDLLLVVLWFWLALAHVVIGRASSTNQHNSNPCILQTFFQMRAEGGEHKTN